MPQEQEALSVQVGVVALEGPCDTRGFSIEARNHPGEALQNNTFFLFEPGSQIRSKACN